jgi:predicted peptidase
MERMRIFLSLLVLSMCTLGAYAQDGPWQRRVFRAGNGIELPYRMIVPKHPGPWPLLVFLHGVGERGTDNEAQLKNGVGEFCSSPAIADGHCLVVVPQCPPPHRWVEVDWALPAHKIPATPSAPMAALMELIGGLPQEFPLDKQRYYLMGLSMGGFGTWDLLARHPDWFAAAVPICGGADLSTAPSLTGIPLWAFHGGRDNVVSVTRSRTMIEALVKAGGHPRYTEYAEVEHNSWVRALAEPELPTWLLKQHR